MKRVSKYALYIAIFIIVEIFIFLTSYQTFFNKKEDYFNNKNKYFQEEYKAVISTYELMADTIFNSIINQPDVINIFKDAHFAKEKRKNELRKKLYRLLEPYYKGFTNQNLRQLHFHLPNSESFLRFHRPNKYGDNLKGFRSTVDLANQMHVFVRSFEEGRIFNGFRYVYPLFDGDHHLGSVEMSVSFSAIENQLEEVYKNEYFFILKREVIESKVFKDEKKNNYINSRISDKYWQENQEIKPKNLSLDIIKKLDKFTQKKFLKKDPGKSFCFNAEINNKDYIVSFLPIYNLEKKHVAYIYCYSDRSIYGSMKKDLYLNLSSFSIVNLTIILLIYFFYSRTNSIRKLYLERKNIEDLRERTEQMVRHDLKNPLSAIIAYSDIMIEYNDLDDNLKENINYIKVSAEKILELINNSKNIMKMEQGTFLPDRKEFDLFELFEDINNSFKPRMNEKNIEIQFFFNEEKLETFLEKKLLIYDDPLLYHQFLSNLLQNAIDASPKDHKITVNIKLNDKSLSFDIHNDGVIPEKIKEKFFEKYVTYGKKEGSGLGTYIIKIIVENLGGNVSFSSDEKKGTNIVINLPKQDHSMS